MNNLIKVNELKQIDGMKFHDIEGGFGDGKKAMLVKEIALIHGKDIGRINEAINNNKKRFNNGIDIIDLKESPLVIDLIDKGIYTQNGVNRSSHIYLLSERGYSKLLKILEDDVAWEQYEKLVDGYFNMRGQAQRPLSPKELLEAQFQYTKEIDTRVSKIEDFVEATELSMADSKRLTKLAKGIVVRLLGGKSSAAYKELSKQVFSDLYKQLHREFGVTSISEIKKKDCDTAKEIIQGYKLPLVLKEQVLILNNQISIGEAM